MDNLNGKKILPCPFSKSELELLRTIFKNISIDGGHARELVKIMDKVDQMAIQLEAVK